MVKKRTPPTASRQPSQEDIERFAAGADGGTPKPPQEAPKEKTMRFNANVPQSLYLAVKVKAAEENVKMNSLVIKWMKEWVNDEAQ